jgi:DNA-binding NtrC family response regulator
MLILKEGEVVLPDDLPERMSSRTVDRKSISREQALSSDGVDLNFMLDEIENNMIIQALEISRGVKSKAANLLGLNRTTLIEKMKKKAIEFNAS